MAVMIVVFRSSLNILRWNDDMTTNMLAALCELTFISTKVEPWCVSDTLWIHIITMINLIVFDVMPFSF